MFHIQSEQKKQIRVSPSPPTHLRSKVFLYKLLGSRNNLGGYNNLYAKSTITTVESVIDFVYFLGM